MAAPHPASGAPTLGAATLAAACWNVGMPDATKFARDVDAVIGKVIVTIETLVAMGIEIIDLNDASSRCTLFGRVAGGRASLTRQYGVDSVAAGGEHARKWRQVAGQWDLAQCVDQILLKACEHWRRTPGTPRRLLGVKSHANLLHWTSVPAVSPAFAPGQCARRRAVGCRICGGTAPMG